MRPTSGRLAGDAPMREVRFATRRCTIARQAARTRRPARRRCRCTSSTTCSPPPPATSRSSPTPRGTSSPSSARSCPTGCARRASSRSPRSSTTSRVYVRLEQARFPGRLEAELPPTRPRAGGPVRARRRCRRRSADALGRWLGERRGRVRLRAARAPRRRGARGAARRARRPRRRRPSASASHCARRRRGARHERGGSGLAILAVDDEPRALADIKHLLRDVGVGRPRRDRDEREGGARLPLGRPRTTRCSSTSTCPRSRAWRSRGCCAASPTRPRSCSSPATRTPRSRRSRSRRSTSSSSRSAASGSSRRSAGSRRSRGPRRAAPPPADGARGGGRRARRAGRRRGRQPEGRRQAARPPGDDLDRPGQRRLRAHRLRRRALPAADAAEPAREGVVAERLRAGTPGLPREPHPRGRAARAAQRHRRAIMRDGTEVPVARRNVAALRRRLHA